MSQRIATSECLKEELPRDVCLKEVPLCECLKEELPLDECVKEVPRE